MGGTLSVAFPASTATLAVLPLRTHGQSKFSISPGPMPTILAGRLAEAEYHGLVAALNSSLAPLAGFGFLALLLPFVLVDLVTVALLAAADPWVLVSPWDYPIADVLLPLGLEFGLLFAAFPLMTYLVGRRMAAVQAKAREVLDEGSRRYGARGVAFQLKQGVANSGAATNLWVEVQVIPLLHVQTAVPVPCPSLYPVLMPSDGGGGGATPGGMGTPRGGGAAGGMGSPGMGGGGTGSAGAEPPGLQVEYLRVLQENQLLRQYLLQCQTLVQHMAQQGAAAAAAAAASAGAPGTPANAGGEPAGR